MCLKEIFSHFWQMELIYISKPAKDVCSLLGTFHMRSIGFPPMPAAPGARGNWLTTLQWDTDRKIQKF